MDLLKSSLRSSEYMERTDNNLLHHKHKNSIEGGATDQKQLLCYT